MKESMCDKWIFGAFDVATHWRVLAHSSLQNSNAILEDMKTMGEGSEIHLKF